MAGKASRLMLVANLRAELREAKEAQQRAEKLALMVCERYGGNSLKALADRDQNATLGANLREIVPPSNMRVVIGLTGWDVEVLVVAWSSAIAAHGVGRSVDDAVSIAAEKFRKREP